MQNYYDWYGITKYFFIQTNHLHKLYPLLTNNNRQKMSEQNDSKIASTNDP